jgi:hypothetical protein
MQNYNYFPKKSTEKFVKIKEGFAVYLWYLQLCADCNLKVVVNKRTCYKDKINNTKYFFIRFKIS